MQLFDKMNFPMLVRGLLATVLMGGASLSQALDIQAYDAQKLQAAQTANLPVALHFHADWCPTCRAQAKAFEHMKDDPALNITLLVVDYDNERDLKKRLGVRAQSTLIVYKGIQERARIGGVTDPAKLKAALAAGL